MLKWMKEVIVMHGAQLLWPAVKVGVSIWLKTGNHPESTSYQLHAVVQLGINHQ